jgi:hypothetical protein
METKPTTLKGCAALLRYLAAYQRAESTARMFSDFVDPLKSLGSRFPEMIADVLERVPR